MDKQKILDKLKLLGEKILKDEIPASEIDRLIKNGSSLEESKEYGIPDRLKVKRKEYTLSDEALKQRRENAQKASEKMQEEGLSTGPKTEAGKKASSRNAWKHGMYAQSFFHRYSKPCRSTCGRYPCSLIGDGKTAPGGECLDKEHIYEAFNAIVKAVKNKEFDDFNALAALDTSKNMQVLRDLQEAVLEDGVVVKSEKIDKEGNIIGHELKPHPVLLVLPKLTEILGFTPKDLMITPKEIAKAGRDDDGIKTIADLMSSVGRVLKKERDR